MGRRAGAEESVVQLLKGHIQLEILKSQTPSQRESLDRLSSGKEGRHLEKRSTGFPGMAED